MHGDSRIWLTHDMGIKFDQRNSLVVGIAMGLRSSHHLLHRRRRGLLGAQAPDPGSLGAGATPWQTLSRVVILTASPGIFSAVMMGLGRAVGETMIVLMATGNTPIMDFMFQGLRTLAANIAVEMPESKWAAPLPGAVPRRLLCCLCSPSCSIPWPSSSASGCVKSTARCNGLLKESTMGKWFKSGPPDLDDGGAVSLSLVAVLGLLLLIGWRGLVYFWPHPIYQRQLEDASGNKSVLIGEDQRPGAGAGGAPRAAGPAGREDREEIDPLSGQDRQPGVRGPRFSLGAGDRYQIARPAGGIAMVERATNGNFYGYITSVKEDGQELTTDLHPALQRVLAERSAKANDLQRGHRQHQLQLERLRLKERKAELDDKLTDQLKAELASERQASTTVTRCWRKSSSPCVPRRTETASPSRTCAASW